MVTLAEKKRILDLSNKETIIYFDMDGVLAKWEVGCTYEQTCAPAYFYNLEPEMPAIEALLVLKKAGFKVCVLSAAYEFGTARDDKTAWLKKYGLEDVDRLFVPCGQNKADFIDAKPCSKYVLVDDYNPNLNKWADTEKNDAEFLAIKFLNGINGESGNWTGLSVHHHTHSELIAHTIADFAIFH